MAAPKSPGNRWSDKEWREAVRVAVMEPYSKGVKKLRRIATVVVDAACEGQAWAVTEVGNRLDGRPAQDVSIDQRVTHDLSSISDAELARIIAEGTSGDRGAKTPNDKAGLH